VKTTVDNNDNRRATRRPISRIAHIATGLGPPLECHMSDISESGTRIVVDYPKAIPQEFLLLLNNDLLRWCRVIWRSDHEIGITFIDTPKSLTTAGPPRRVAN
jgi:hypothetical protein